MATALSASVASDAAFFESCAASAFDVVALVEFASPPPPIFDEMPELCGGEGGVKRGRGGEGAGVERAGVEGAGVERAGVERVVEEAGVETKT